VHIITSWISFRLKLKFVNFWLTLTLQFNFNSKKPTILGIIHKSRETTRGEGIGGEKNLINTREGRSGVKEDLVLWKGKLLSICKKSHLDKAQDFKMYTGLL